MENVANKQQEHHLHHPPPRTYHITFVLLIVFMFLTIFMAQFSFGGAINNIIAMTIASVKAVLVVLYFMQVKFNSKLTWVWAALGFVWLIFLFGTMGDYMTREWIHVTGWH